MKCSIDGKIFKIAHAPKPEHPKLSNPLKITHKQRDLKNPAK